MTDELPGWVAGYIGLPFAAMGRDRDGIDCWGLLRLVLAEQFAVALPSWDGVGYTPGSSAARLELFMADHAAGWCEVMPGAERLGDGVLARVGGYKTHVGLVVAPGTMLHIEEDIDSSLAEYREPLWRDRIAGFYRILPGG